MAKSDEIAFLDVAQVSAQLRERRISPVELTRAMLARIKALDPILNAYICVTEATALEEANRAERELADGKNRGPLHETSAKVSPESGCAFPIGRIRVDFSNAVISLRFDVDALAIRPKHAFCIGFHQSCNDAAVVGFEPCIGVHVRVHVQSILVK
ncbi:amidase family protein [Burkholderia mayonis]|uniref:Uncharacterized protein n=1 Tax=Burkholderia mayonis TaxID=1385591 RepID=A0A1B4FU90_9BURK|nr:amidase family protein [Burkholderia mayonis]AOJ07236.1 hypothetical protein WS71_07885 [Burkholderia mayonis]KVE49711.1 hypothetical protein WS71_00565 [Burkholderia mayonis]